MSDNIINIVDQIIKQKGTTVDQAIPILQAIQDEFNYLPEIALKRVCDQTEISPSRIYGISTFYTQFRHQPVGKHIIKVCVGTACHVKGAMQVYDSFKRSLNLKENEDTDADGLFTLQKVACLGCCSLAPVIMINDETHGNLTVKSLKKVIKQYQRKIKNGEDKS